MGFGGFGGGLGGFGSSFGGGGGGFFNANLSTVDFLIKHVDNIIHSVFGL